MKTKKRFDALLGQIEAEAKSEDKKGVQELEALTQYYRVFNEFLELRKKRQLTQKALAATSGIDQGEISRIEKGAANPTLATLQALLIALGGELRVVERDVAGRG